MVRGSRAGIFVKNHSFKGHIFERTESLREIMQGRFLCSERKGFSEKEKKQNKTKQRKNL